MSGYCLYPIQEIISEGTNSGVVLEYEDEKLTIKNTELGLPRIFADYKELFNNPIDFMTFVQDYKSDDKLLVLTLQQGLNQHKTYPLF